MRISKKHIADKPFAQALAVLVMWLLAVLAGFMTNCGSGFYDVVTASALLLFVVASPLMGIFVKEKWLRYTGFSIAAFATLTMSLYISTFYISTFMPQQSSPRKPVLITLIIFYLMLVMISGIYRMVKQMIEEA